jgi:FtsP/CotA-like multicopper oxidase with cupredoxin domain
MTRTAVGSLLTLALLLATTGSSRRAPETIQPNDHTRPAGTLSKGVLSIALETRLGRLRPEGDGGKSLDSVFAFAEVGRAASTPGPMIRVPVGTAVRGTLHNTLTRPLVVFGLGNRRGVKDSLVISAGATGDFAFTADQAGTFAYFARTHVDPIVARDPTEQALNGAIVVDRPNAPRDRVLGISWNVRVDPTSANGVGAATMTINGLSWPHTERRTHGQGD